MKKSAWNRAGQVIVIALAVLFSLVNALQITGHGGYLHMLRSYRDKMEIWQWLSLCALILAVVGISGAWLNIYRKRSLLAVAFLALTLPMPLIIEANRCDYDGCRYLSWLLIPRSVVEGMSL